MSFARQLPVFIGRCAYKRCKARARVTFSETKEVTIRSRYGSYTVEEPAVVLPSGANRSNRAMTFEEVSRYGWMPHCVEHRRPLRFKPIMGVENADIACHPRCMGATGPSCECSCGGENHGGRWG